MQAPQTHQWGPELWNLLHSSAERIGTPSSRLQQHEELRLWNGLLSSLQYSLPCPLCKRHYTEFYQSHSLPSITKEHVRQWLFDLHCQVNTRTNKPNTISIENIPDLYQKPFHFSRHAGVVLQHMKLAVFHKWCSREDVQRTTRILEEMKRFYDFF